MYILSVTVLVADGTTWRNKIGEFKDGKLFDC
jgi:hypothetical protein